MHIKINKNYLYINDYKIKCCIGKRGINKNKIEGDLTTPKITLKFKYVLYRPDRVKNLYSRIKKIKINKKMGWCDDYRSNKYNMLINYPFNYSSEKLFRKDNIYDIVIVTDYNTNPVIKKKGSAIFLHIAKKNYSPTKGCIAISKKDMRLLLKKTKKRTKLEFF